MNVDHLALVLGFIGSTGSTTISFILPALFYLKLFPESEWRGARTCAHILLWMGVVIMIVCLALNTWHAVTGQ
jgi:amino acid permease